MGKMGNTINAGWGSSRVLLSIDGRILAVGYYAVRTNAVKLFKCNEIKNIWEYKASFSDCASKVLISHDGKTTASGYD